MTNKVNNLTITIGGTGIDCFKELIKLLADNYDELPEPIKAWVDNMANGG